MPIISIASPQRGAGKTTLALNFSFSLARRGWRTLLVDTDPQGAVGLSLRNGVRSAPGLTACLGAAAPFEAMVLRTRLPDLYLLPAGAGHVLADWGESLQRGLPRLLEAATRCFDVVLLDTPAGLETGTLVALGLSDYCIGPLKAEPLAVSAVQRVTDAVDGLREAGCGLQVAGLVLNMLQLHDEASLNAAQEVWTLLPSHLLLEGYVPYDPAFYRASAFGVPVGMLSRRPPAVAGVFEQITTELEGRIGLDMVRGQEDAIPYLA
jgi:chromosome partitioning protein